MADWESWRTSSTSGGNDLLEYYTSNHGNSPSLMNSVRVNSSFSSHMFTPSPSKYDAGNTTFCDQTNTDQCTSMLNQELMVLGLPSLFKDDCDTVDMCRFINNCHELFCLHQRNVRHREELETRYHRTLSDYDQCENLQSRLKTDMEHCKRQAAQYQEKERQVLAKNRTLVAKLKTEKEEVKRLLSVVSSRDLQYKHDLKKRERETNKLKERLHQVLMDKKHQRQIGMDIVNAVQRPDGRRSTWKTGSNKQEEEMYRSVISNYEDRQQELMMENSELRNTLQRMQSEMVSLLNQQHSPNKSSLRNGSPDQSLLYSDDEVSIAASENSQISVDTLSEGMYQMPYDMVRKDIEKNFHETCLMLKEVVRQSKKRKSTQEHVKKGKNELNGEMKFSTPMSNGNRISNGNHSNEQVEDLVDKLTKYKRIVTEQEELLQQSLHCRSKSVENSFLHDSQLLQDKESLAEEKRLFYQAKANFDEERKQFSDAAIRLGRERKELEDEKSKVLQQQFLQLTPFSNDPDRSVSPLKSAHGRKEGSRLLPSTPAHLTPSIVVSTPGSAELYRVMGLAPFETYRNGSCAGKPPISPQVTKAPTMDACRKSSSTNMVKKVSVSDGHIAESPSKRTPTLSSSMRTSPGPSLETLTNNLESLKKTLFNKKPSMSCSRHSLE